MLEQFLKDCSQWEGPMLEQEKKPEEEGATGRIDYRLTPTPCSPPPLCHLRVEGGGKRVGNERLKLRLERRGGRCGRCLSFCLCCSPSISGFLLALFNINFPCVCFACDGNW